MWICIKKICRCSQIHILYYLEKGLNEEAKFILEGLENLSELVGDSQKTLLHYSAEYGNVEMTQYFIDKGCNIDAQDDYGNTAWLLAIEVKDLKLVQVLMKSNANIYLNDNYGFSTVEYVFCSYVRASIRLLSADFFVSYEHRLYKMVFDKVNDDFSMGTLTQYLSDASNIIKFAIVVSGNEELTKYMLRNGYSMDFREHRTNSTALHCAIRLARLQTAKILIEHGANVDLLDDFNGSPLSSYVKHCEDIDENCELLAILLRHSTSLSIPRDVHTDVEKLLLHGKKKTLKAILMSGINIAACINKDDDLLSILIQNENDDILDGFDEVNIKPNVNARHWGGRTALMEAVAYGCPKKVEFLLQHGADINVASSFGPPAISNIPLCDITGNPAKEIKLAKVAEILLQNGANPEPFFSSSLNSTKIFSLAAKVITAHMAILGQSWPESCLDIIESEPRLKDHFDLCTKQIEEMKHFEICGTVTLFKLLTEREDRIVAYARNQEFFEAWSCAMKSLSHFESYYVDTLRRRVSKAFDAAKLQRKVAAIIHTLTGLCTDTYHIIIYKIINYLDNQTLQSVCDISNSCLLAC